MTPGRPVRIGLTGPIGCGKSTVAGWLADRGAALIDADRVAREVTAPGQPGHDAVLDCFGDRVRAADATLDRAALARIVFADPAALRELESIIHPLVRPAILARIEAAEMADAPAVVIEAIKLLEGGLAELCDEVWLIVCDDQRSRLIERGMEPDDADRRIAAQSSLFRDAPGIYTDAVRRVDTSGAREVAERRIADLWQRAVG